MWINSCMLVYLELFVLMLKCPEDVFQHLIKSKRSGAVRGAERCCFTTHGT